MLLGRTIDEHDQDLANKSKIDCKLFLLFIIIGYVDHNEQEFTEEFRSMNVRILGHEWIEQKYRKVYKMKVI